MGGALLEGASSFSSCRRPARPRPARPCAPGIPSIASTGALSHHERGDAARPAAGWHITASARRTPPRGFPGAFAFVLLALLALSLLCPCAAAAANGSLDPETLLALREIVYDRTFPPHDTARMPLVPRDHGADLAARETSKTASAAGSSTASAAHTKAASAHTATVSAAHTKTASAAHTSLTADASSASTSMPQPFDTSLGSNFTTSTCPTFFDDFLANSTFQSCVPLSLLLQTSSAFFDATASFARVTQVLDASCDVDVATCASLMDYYATEITRDENCGADYRLDNPTVVEAYKGLVAYQPVYQAGCLKAASGSYCFANAITNVSSPTDSYPYYLPLGVALPGGSRPTCDSCLKNTMNALWSYTSNSTQPVSQTYSDAASQVNINCGPTFINGTNAVARSRAAAAPGAPGLLTSVALLASLAVLFF